MTEVPSSNRLSQEYRLSGRLVVADDGSDQDPPTTLVSFDSRVAIRYSYVLADAWIMHWRPRAGWRCMA